jgi:hypothetical protein
LFYAGLEGRKFGLARAIECGLEAATYNIVYPPGEDEAVTDDFEVLINPQSFRLPYSKSTWSPKLAEHLGRFGPVSPDALVESDADGTPRALNALGRRLCADFSKLQDDYHATDIVAPYFMASSLDDPALETSLLCAKYVEDSGKYEHVFAGVMLDSSHLANQSTFERIANRLTSPDAPSLYYLDIDTPRNSRRPLRNAEVLTKLKELFDALNSAEKFTLLARCDLEGLLLRAVSGLDAFSIGYYHSDRLAQHSRLVQDYERPSFIRSPTPYVFSPKLLTDLPRDVAQAVIRDGEQALLSCGCPACAQLIRSRISIEPAILCSAHFYAALTKLDQRFNSRNLNRNARNIHALISAAEQGSGDVTAPSGTFSHLRKWREWLEEQFGIE